MSTLREHLEAIRDRHREFVDDSAWHRTIVWCHACDEVKFPCPDREDAVAALRLLDEADHWYPVEGERRTKLSDPDDLSDEAWVHISDAPCVSRSDADTGTPGDHT